MRMLTTAVAMFCLFRIQSSSSSRRQHRALLHDSSILCAALALEAGFFCVFFLKSTSVSFFGHCVPPFGLGDAWAGEVPDVRHPQIQSLDGSPESIHHVSRTKLFSLIPQGSHVTFSNLFSVFVFEHTELYLRFIILSSLEVEGISLFEK